jgi:hypothetical protein
LDGAGAIYFARESLSETEHGKTRKTCIQLESYSSDGVSAWRRELPSNRKDQDFPTDLKADPRGGVVLAGSRLGPIAYILCAGYSSTGILRHANKIYTDPGPLPVAPSIAVDADAGVVVTGSIFTGVSGLKGHDQDVLSAYFQADGTKVWSSKFDGPDRLRDRGLSVAVSPGRIYIASQMTEGSIPEIQILNYSPFPDRQPQSNAK